MKLTLDIDTEAGTLRTVEKTKNAQGQFDLKTHFGAVIGPKTDLTDVPEPIKAIAEVVQANYVEPVVEPAE